MQFYDLAYMSAPIGVVPLFQLTWYRMIIDIGQGTGGPLPVESGQVVFFWKKI